MQPFSIPVQITLQGGRKRQGRTDFPTSGKGSCRVNSHGEPPGAHGKLPTSAGEDRATKLGFAMMGSSVLMFFLLGTTVLKPLMLSVQREETNCTAIHAHVVDVWLDCTFICGAGCHGLGKYPCVQVFVNLTHLGQEALLHYDEEAVHINPQRDVTDCSVGVKQTLTVSGEHMQ
uniref:calcium-activated potassium channel subunit beta-3 n=1 Tax=Jaculus jaculus TaxID=51337 RepID=UPI001E1B2E6D|nr:calcium-activated potassium channel subunit beta-3 [Jaculus jaculus]